MIERLERAFDHVEPKKRRRAAIWMLLISLALGHLNMGAYIGGFISESSMNAVTNYLSWLAITITALDIVVTTDVRKEVEEEGEGPP